VTTVIVTVRTHPNVSVQCFRDKLRGANSGGASGRRKELPRPDDLRDPHPVRTAVRAGTGTGPCVAAPRGRTRHGAPCVSGAGVRQAGGRERVRGRADARRVCPSRCAPPATLDLPISSCPAPAGPPVRTCPRDLSLPVCSGSRSRGVHCHLGSRRHERQTRPFGFFDGGA